MWRKINTFNASTLQKFFEWRLVMQCWLSRTKGNEPRHARAFLVTGNTRGHGLPWSLYRCGSRATRTRDAQKTGSFDSLVKITQLYTLSIIHTTRDQIKIQTITLSKKRIAVRTMADLRWTIIVRSVLPRSVTLLISIIATAISNRVIEIVFPPWNIETRRLKVKHGCRTIVVSIEITLQ